nr:hypothetical protein [uncultured Carboxylicivirga sp.]
MNKFISIKDFKVWQRIIAGVFSWGMYPIRFSFVLFYNGKIFATFLCLFLSDLIFQMLIIKAADNNAGSITLILLII